MNETGCTKIGVESAEEIELLKENVGKFEGGGFKETFAFLAESIFDKGTKPLDVEFPEGLDSPAVMRLRSKSFIEDMLTLVDNSEMEADETILATTHGYTGLYLAEYLASTGPNFLLVDASEILFKVAPNSAFVKLAIEKKSKNDTGLRKIQVLAEHDRSHLASILKSDPVGSFSKGTVFDGCMHQ